MKPLTKEFWDERYKSNDTGWDIGKISTPLKNYFDQLNDKGLKILIPGSGHAYEAEYLHLNGFKQVYVVDVSGTALNAFKKRVPNFPNRHLINDDFFNVKIKFDLIIEQTFFCAINPNLRKTYAEKMNELLYAKGKLVGVLFDEPINYEKPPFGGCKEEYVTYFEPYFDIQIMEPCYNSVETRKNRELFIKLVKK